MIIALLLFIIYFFIVPWTPIYEPEFTLTPTRNFILDDEGNKIIGWQYPSIVILAPLIIFLSLILMIFDIPKIRPTLKELKPKIKNYIKFKIEEDHKQKEEWIFGENKK